MDKTPKPLRRFTLVDADNYAEWIPEYHDLGQFVWATDALALQTENAALRAQIAKARAEEREAIVADMRRLAGDLPEGVVRSTVLLMADELQRRDAEGGSNEER